jgi:hypothetical protein
LKYIPLTEKDGLKTAEIIEAVLRYGGVHEWRDAA